MMPKHFPKLIAAYIGSSFIFHLVWENAQAPLFAGFESFRQHFLICLQGAATGDMIFMAVIYGCLAVIHRDIYWIADKNAYRHPATWVIPIVIGILLAVGFELWAIHAVDRWEYGAMPIIPVLQIGITPLLQMILIPVAVIGLGRHINHSFD